MEKQIVDLCSVLSKELKTTKDERMKQLLKNSSLQLYELLFYIKSCKKKKVVEPEPGLRPIDPGSLFSDDQMGPID